MRVGKGGHGKPVNVGHPEGRCAGVRPLFGRCDNVMPGGAELVG